MAFELPPLPSFNVQVPDLQQKALEGAQLRNMLSEMSLRRALAPGQIQLQQQQVQQQQMATQMQQMQLRDAQIMGELLSGGDVAKESGGDFSHADNVTAFTGLPKDDPAFGFLSALAKRGYSGPGLLAQAKSMLQTRGEALKQTEESQAIQKSDREYWQDQLNALYEASPEQRGPLLAAKMPMLVENSRGDQRLQQLASLLNGHPEHIDEVRNTLLGENAVLGYGKAKAETQEAETKAQEAAARARGEVTPEMATAQAQDIAKQKALVPTEIAKAVGTEVAKQQALAPQLQQIASTTRTGRNYINREDIPKGSEGVVEQRAAAAGVPIVDKEVAGTLTDIDTAKANMQSMLGLVQKKLPQGPGERIFKGPENKLAAAAQTDPDLAAMGTFRNAAIQTMRAVAGSKGLRINQAEVQMAIDNDIPKMTDTWAVAQSKINQLNTFLDNAETAHLVRNRAATPGAQAVPRPAGATMRVPGSDGHMYWSDGKANLGRAD